MKIVGVLVLLSILLSFNKVKSKPNVAFVQYVEAEQKTSIKKTKWIKEIAPNCFDYIYFASYDSVILYRCEVPEKIFGKYILKNDTVLINTLKGEYDDDFPEGSRHRHTKKRFKMFVKGDTLLSVRNPKLRYYKAPDSPNL